MKTFNLPDLGEGLQEAEIVSWHVKEGDVVKVDQPLLSVETAKAVVDVPSPWAGKIAKLHGKAGDIIPTHSALVDFDIAGDSAAPAAKPAAAPAAAAKKSVPIEEDSGTVVGAVPTSNDLVAETAIIRKKQKKDPARVKALPSVRILAKQLGVDLTDIEPTGKNDTVSADDVRRATQGAAPAPAASTHTAKWDIAKPRTDVKYGVAEPLRGPRRAMHASMTRSRSEVAECTLFDDADIHNWQAGQDITVRIVRAIVAGCRAEPELNAWYDGEKLERTLHERVDLAMAVDTPDGLIVPILRKVESKNAQQLRDDLNRIKEATRNRSVSPADMKDPTITLSNFGMMAGRYATPVVVPPQVAILGTGGLRHDVVPVMGGIEVHKRIPLSVTFDHRCITGGTACRWLAAVIKDLEKAH
ncbi:MAG TPA: dihydrolipoamide acetyltransferase family protein [Gammaproteobacteria bacterium]|jgi:pyruvate dehydrogenase E2 component (dihydrolipoamide acetyltransferase)|nr:dihydrolipoamide acetyltransferase family protein [Gammaproteobacteria bacterium]